MFTPEPSYYNALAVTLALGLALWFLALPITLTYCAWRALRDLRRIADALESLDSASRFHVAAPILTDVAKSEVRHSVVANSAFGR